MNTQQQDDIVEEAIPGKHFAALLAAEVAGGAVAGAAMGLLAGLPGAAVGALIGAAAGGLAGVQIERSENEKRAHEEELDRDIGVIGGSIGEPSLRHPPPKHGLYHASTLGISSGEADDSDGPIQNVDGA